MGGGPPLTTERNHMHQIKTRAGALLLALATVLGLALAGAGTAAADVPGYPTVEQYHGKPTFVPENLSSTWLSALYGEIADWNTEAAVGAPLTHASSCPAGQPCVFVRLVNQGATGHRVTAAYADAGGGFDSSATVYVNTYYPTNATQVRVEMCHAVAAAFLSYSRPASAASSSCVTTDPIGSYSSGNSADRTYFDVGFNSSFSS